MPFFHKLVHNEMQLINIIDYLGNTVLSELTYNHNHAKRKNEHIEHLLALTSVCIYARATCICVKNTCDFTLLIKMLN